MRIVISSCTCVLIRHLSFLLFSKNLPLFFVSAKQRSHLLQQELRTYGRLEVIPCAACFDTDPLLLLLVCSDSISLHDSPITDDFIFIACTESIILSLWEVK